MDSSRLTLLGVPINSVGRDGGTEDGPAGLRALLDGNGLGDAGDTSQHIRGSDRSRTNGWLAYDDIVKMTGEVRGRVGEITAAGEIPLVLGGCCTLIPAVLAGARDTYGDIGLAYFDGHLDLFTGNSSPTGEGADMPMAATLGMAPPEMLNEIGHTPVIAPQRIYMVGSRDQEELQMIAPLPAGIDFGAIHDRESLRHEDLSNLGSRIATLLDRDQGRFWLHIDVDVLGQDCFPATDYLMPDGLSMPELKAMLAPLAASPGLIGVNVTCFNPDRDPEGACGRDLASMLVSILSI